MNTDPQHSVVRGEEKTRAWYHQEPWLAMCLSCFIPLLAAIYAPAWLRIPLLVLCGALLAASMVMLNRHTRTK